MAHSEVTERETEGETGMEGGSEEGRNHRPEVLLLLGLREGARVPRAHSLLVNFKRKSENLKQEEKKQATQLVSH